jgi:hypothetical protein
MDAGGDAPLPLLRLSHAGSAAGSAMSAESLTGGCVGSAQHTPATAAQGLRPPCSPFAPAPRWSPRGEEGPAAPLSALKRSRSDASGAPEPCERAAAHGRSRVPPRADASGDSGALVPPPRPLTNKRFLSEARTRHTPAMLCVRACLGGRAARLLSAAPRR